MYLRCNSSIVDNEISKSGECSLLCRHQCGSVTTIKNNVTGLCTEDDDSTTSGKEHVLFDYGNMTDFYIG